MKVLHLFICVFLVPSLGYAQVSNQTVAYYNSSNELIRVEEVAIDSNITSAKIHLNGGSVFVEKKTYPEQQFSITELSYHFLKFPNNFYDSFNLKTYSAMVEWEDTVNFYWGERNIITDSVLWERDTIWTIDEYRTIDSISNNYSKLRVKMILNSELDTSKSSVKLVETNKVFFLSDSLRKMQAFDKNSSLKFQVEILYRKDLVELKKSWFEDAGVLKNTISDSIVWESDTSFQFYRRFGGSEKTYCYHYQIIDSALISIGDNSWTKYIYPKKIDIIQAFLLDNVVFYDIPLATIKYSRINDPQPTEVVSSQGDTSRIEVTRDVTNLAVEEIWKRNGTDYKRMKVLSK